MTILLLRNLTSVAKKKQNIDSVEYLKDGPYEPLSQDPSDQQLLDIKSIVKSCPLLRMSTHHYISPSVANC